MLRTPAFLFSLLTIAGLAVYFSTDASMLPAGAACFLPALSTALMALFYRHPLWAGWRGLHYALNVPLVFFGVFALGFTPVRFPEALFFLLLGLIASGLAGVLFVYFLAQTIEADEKALPFVLPPGSAVLPVEADFSPACQTARQKWKATAKGAVACRDFASVSLVFALKPGAVASRQPKLAPYVLMLTVPVSALLFFISFFLYHRARTLRLRAFLSVGDLTPPEVVEKTRGLRGAEREAALHEAGRDIYRQQRDKIDRWCGNVETLLVNKYRFSPADSAAATADRTQAAIEFFEGTTAEYKAGYCYRLRLRQQRPGIRAKHA